MTSSYLDALREHRSGNLDLAEKLYRCSLAEDPENPEPLHLLSILLAQKNDFLPARDFAKQALALNPDSTTLHNSMGNIMHNLNEHEAAITHYQTAIKLDPDNGSAYNNLGNVYYHLGKLDDAKQQYHQATVTRADYVDAHYNLGLVLIKQDLKPDAKKHLESVLELQPEHGPAHSNLGYLLQSEGEFGLAKQHYQKSLELIGGTILSCHNLGVLLTNEGNYSDAIDCFKKVLALDPDYEEGLYNLGAVFLLQRKSQEALPYFLHLAKLISDFDVCYNLGVIYLDLMRYDEAIDCFNQALDLKKNDFAANANLGSIYLRQRDFTMAEKQYLKASSLDPDNEEIKHILVAIQQKNSDAHSPAKYVRNLFDQYSPFFEEHADALGYKAPEILFDALYPKFISQDNSLSILDLGCGTGLSGVRFRPFAKRLIGIDISEKMLELAAKKEIYTDLITGSIEDNIGDFSDIDLIIAADSLVYFGDLGDLFTKAYAVLNRGGIFAFTVEISEDLYPYHLQRTVRFSHSQRYIEELALQNNFTILHSDNLVLRKQDQGSVVGALFILEK